MTGPATPDLPDAYGEDARLDDLRLTATQDRIKADLALGGGPPRRSASRRRPGAPPGWRSSARTSWPVNRPWRAAITYGVRIRGRDRMYRLLASRPLAAFFERVTEMSATNIKLPEYPA